MVPLVVQLVSWAGFWIAGLVGVLPSTASPVGAMRLALSVMFFVTGAAHFTPRTRADLVRMVPPALPAPALLVSLTGVLELAGALGLLLSSVARLASLSLAAMLVGLFPANIHAARADLEIAGRAATPLVIRLPLQLFWIACLVWVALAR